MTDTPKMTLKIEAARRQLGTALALYLQDRDPVSVHCLAASATELVEHFAKTAGRAPFLFQILAQNPQAKLQDLHKAQRQYYNSFKHATQKSGVFRDDERLLAEFTDARNDHALFTGWYDYELTGQLLPVEAQVYIAFYFAKYGDQLLLPEDLAKYKVVFPQLKGLSRAEQKRGLRSMIEDARKTNSAKSRTTDQRPLILTWPPA